VKYWIVAATITIILLVVFRNAIPTFVIGVVDLLEYGRWG
jgi:hypothetical protein